MIQVGIIMGSDSDWSTLKEAATICQQFKINYEAKVISAHRTPFDMVEYGRTAHQRLLRVIIAGAGGAAHLPGMVASCTPLPVIGVPVQNSALNGLDALLSIVQMPGGVPVATVGIGNAKNAGLLAVSILASSDLELQKKLLIYKEKMATESRDKNKNLDPLSKL
jgi:5-(carboxyamino)imidazole ribonucleotide mutase